MPASKNSTKRYYIIDRCLTGKTKKYWSADDFIQKLEDHDISINARTLRYDIEAMRFDEALGYKAPIVYSKVHKGYFYSDENFSINTLQLNEEQLNALEFVVDTLHEYEGLKVMQDFQAVISKLAGVLTQLAQPQKVPHIEFEKAPYYKGLELRDSLLKAIQKKETLVISYTTFGRSYPIKHTLHPYLLKEHKNRWYIVGLLHSRRVPITLALDRIDKVDISEIAFIENTRFDPGVYFSDFLGITCTQGPVEEIILEATPALAGYIKTQHLHHTQTILHEDKKCLRFALRLIVNYELISQILGYGSNLKVIQPLSLQQQVKQQLMENLECYT